MTATPLPLSLCLCAAPAPVLSRSRVPLEERDAEKDLIRDASETERKRGHERREKLFSGEAVERDRERAKRLEIEAAV